MIPMSHIYIAGPMSGYPDLNKEAFNEADRHLREMGWITFNPAISDITIRTAGLPEEQAYRMCLEVDLTWICMQAHAMFFLQGWEYSKGARAEHATASAIGLKLFYDNGVIYPRPEGNFGRGRG